MNMKKIAAVAAAAVMAAGICAGVPAGTEKGSLLAVTAEAASGDFVIDENGVLTKYEGTDKNVTIPKNVKEIGSSAFDSNFDIESVTIGSNVECIGSVAFLNCENLKTVKIEKGSNKLKILTGAFQNCYSLTSVTIPSNCTEIYGEAFFNCIKLEKLTIPAKTKIITENHNEHHFGYAMTIDGQAISEDFVADGKRAANIPFKSDTGGVHSGGVYFKEVIPVQLTVTVTKGSDAEKYCKENGVKYAYDDGSSSDTTSAKPTTAPAVKKLAAPTGIKGTASSDKIVLTWNKVDGAEGYRIYKYDEKTGKYLRQYRTT